MRGSAAFRTGIAPGGALAGPWVRDPLWTRARAVPSLDLRFADNKSLVDATTGASLVTFTRASSATYVGSDGVLRSAVTNLVLRSEEFDNAYWTKTNSSTTQDAIAAPNGTITAEKLLTNTTSGIHAVRRDETVLASTAYTLSFYAKPGEYTFLAINHGHTLSADYHTFFDLSNGTIGTSAAGNTATIQSVGNGWYRCSVTRTTGASQTSLSSRALACQADNVTSFVGDTASGIYLWGAQLEQSATVGEYIPTTSTINSAPRFDHNPTTGESLGLLVEEARTNLLLRSEEFDTTWARTSVSPFGVGSAVNVETAPNGTLTADLIAVANGINSGSGFVVQDITKAATSTTYTVTTFAKAQDWNAVTLHAHDVATNNNRATVTFSLATGVITTAAAAAGTFSAASAITATPFINGWFRVNLTFTSSTETGLRVRLIPNNSTTVTSDGTNGIYLWGAQLEAGAFPTSYIPTTSATVTRAADVASITGSNFSSWYNQTEGTVFSDSNIIASQVQTQTVWQLGGGTILTSLRQPQGTSNQFRALIGGTFTASPGTGGLLSAGTSKAGVAYLGTAGRLQVASSGVDSTGSSLDANKLDIGSLNPGTSLNGTIKRLVYWGQRLPNNVLQAITQ